MTTSATETVLLTGISGFMAKHVALELLRSGYRVRGTVRSIAKRDQVFATLKRQGADISRLEIVEADLEREAGWDAAAAQCRYVQHTASPFPTRQPKNKFGLVPVAKGGTLRVIEAAKRAGVERIVLTSSVVAVYYGHGNNSGRSFGESDFSDVSSSTISPYAVSKTEAEKAGWAAVQGTALELAVVNPAFVLGPVLDNDAGTSADVIAMMMRGRMPAVPDVSFGIVDVRDVAMAHLAAMETPEAAGRRFLLSGGSRTLREIGRHIANAMPGYASRMPKFTLPDAVVRAAALFSTQAASLVPELGARKALDTQPATSVLGLSFRAPEEAVAAMARSLVDVGLVGAPRSSSRDEAGLQP